MPLTFARKPSMQHQKPIRNLWIELFIPLLIAIAPGPWLFRYAGIDIAIAPFAPKFVIVVCYCIGAFVFVRLVIHRVIRISRYEQQQQIQNGEQDARDNGR